jgi:hypothetical protein
MRTPGPSTVRWLFEHVLSTNQAAAALTGTATSYQRLLTSTRVAAAAAAALLLLHHI